MRERERERERDCVRKFCEYLIIDKIRKKNKVLDFDRVSISDIKLSFANWILVLLLTEHQFLNERRRLFYKEKEVSL